jgi:hypothetical protein
MNEQIATLAKHATVLSCAGYIGTNLWDKANKLQELRGASRLGLVKAAAGAGFVTALLTAAMYADREIRIITTCGTLVAILLENI